MCNIPFILTLTLFQIQDKVTKNLVFLHTLYKTGGTLCARLSPNRFTYIHIPGANQLYNHCRCATYLSFWPWLYFRSRTRSQKTLFSCILYIRRVILCVRDSAQTASHIFTYLATYLSFWPWPHFRSRTRSQRLSFFCMLYLNHNDWQLCHFLHVNFTFP